MTEGDQPLAGKHALVTGGGTNIGKGITRRLLEGGATVTIASRKQEVLDETVGELSTELPNTSVRAAVCDVTSMQEVDRVLGSTSQEMGGLDIVVANAGGGLPTSFFDLDEEQWRAELDVNVIGTANTFRAGAAAMRESGGVMVATSSHVAISPGLGLTAYSCAKAAVDMLVRCLAIELAPLRIRVNAVRPGYVPQPDEAWIPAEARTAFREFEADALERTVLGRLGTPKDIADTVFHLVGPTGSWITGQSITVDGGGSLHSTSDMRKLAQVLSDLD